MSDSFLTSLAEHSGCLMLGYGSLLSHCSRKHSNIDSPALAVTLHGWQRSWTSRARHEDQTYVGALPQAGAELNAALFAMQTPDEDFRLRERDYEFVPLELASLSLHVADAAKSALIASLSKFEILICKTLKPLAAESQFPVHQSYLDTCMQGCIEMVDEEFAKAFAEQTSGLLPHWLNDRSAPKYPRAAKVTLAEQAKIDELLEEVALLQHRCEA